MPATHFRQSRTTRRLSFREVLLPSFEMQTLCKQLEAAQNIVLVTNVRDYMRDFEEDNKVLNELSNYLRAPRSGLKCTQILAPSFIEMSSIVRVNEDDRRSLTARSSPQLVAPYNASDKLIKPGELGNAVDNAARSDRKDPREDRRVLFIQSVWKSSAWKIGEDGELETSRKEHAQHLTGCSSVFSETAENTLRKEHFIKNENLKN